MTRSKWLLPAPLIVGGVLRNAMPPNMPFDASITSASSSATPASRRTSTATPSASTWSPTPAWRRGCEHEAGYVLRQGEITFVLASPLRADHPETPRLVAARRRRAGHRPGGGRRRGGLRDGRRAAGAVGVDAADAARGRARRLRVRHDPRLRRHDAHASSTATATAASSPPAIEPLDPDRYSPRTFHPVGLMAIDHIVGQRRGREDGRVGAVLRGRAGLLACSSTSTTRTSAPSTRP